MTKLANSLPMHSMTEQTLQKQVDDLHSCLNIIVARAQQAEEANKKNVQFLLSMQHDIKTPISHIVGLTDILCDSPEVPKKFQEHMRLINISGKRLMDLITDMLHFADIEAGTTPHRTQEFNLKDIINKIIELHALTIQDKGLQVLVDYDENIAKRLIGDNYRLHRALLNLFANALKFTPAGSVKIIAKVVKALADARLELELSVEDTGIGISEDKYEVIFDRFTRIPAAGNNQYEGSGLGLWMVKKFIEEMNGKISVSSEVGNGTKFTCIFPCEIAAGIKEVEHE